MSLKLSRNKQFGIKHEAVAGSAETLSASDYGLELTELTANADVEMVENDVFKNSLSASASRVGKKTASGTIAGEFKNSGTLNTEPKVGKVLEIARMKKLTVRGMAFTGATGTMVRGVSRIVGGTSNAVGIGVKIETTKIYIAVISGTFQNAETLTATGWSATAGAQDASATGFAYMPASDSTSEKTATININDGGIAKPLYGAVAGFGLELNTDSYAKWTSSFMGVMGADWGGDATEVTGITYETETQAIVNNAGLSIGGSFTPITTTVTADLGNQTMVIKDLNSATWLKYGVVTDRDVTGTILVMAIDETDYDIYSAFFAGDVASLVFTIGSGAGKAIEVVIPAMQYQGIQEGDSEGFLTQTITFKATGEDNEMLVWFR